MVISAENPIPPQDPMASASAPARAAAETQSHLHNFSFPVLKKWGSQRVLRCLHVNGKGETFGSPPPIRDGDGNGDAPLEQVREKLLVHLREAEGRFKMPETVASPASPSPPQLEVAPWNLRARRTPVKDPYVSPPRAAGSREERGGAAHVRTVRLRSEDVEKRERAMFSITLTREEIDEDIYAVTGSRARRRPKKRPRNVQKQLDMLFPGSWLSEITADSYKVPD